MNKLKITKEARTKAVSAIQSYFLMERDEEIGNLQAELLLDFILDKIGPMIYDQAIADAHALLLQQVDELYVLQKLR